ncbi:hypothetical protein DsansV1_C07g0070311 [Dioscorea sansibarensis]
MFWQDILLHSCGDVPFQNSLQKQLGMEILVSLFGCLSCYQLSNCAVAFSFIHLISHFLCMFLMSSFHRQT